MPDESFSKPARVKMPFFENSSTVVMSPLVFSKVKVCMTIKISDPVI